MMVNALFDAMLCILTVQGWVHGCAGLGAQLCMDGARPCIQKEVVNGTFLGRHLSVGRTFVFHHDHGYVVALGIAVSVYLDG